jgi:hypothetical protein
VNVLSDRTLQEGRIDGAARINGTHVKRAARALAGAQTAAVESGDPHVAEVEPADTIDLSGDALSLSIGSERSEGRKWRLFVVAAVLSLVAVVGGFMYWASDVNTATTDLPTVPRAALTRPAAPPKMLLPSDEELERYFREMLLGIARAPLGEIPRDRDELD